jgi:hypothetical protein
MTPDEILDRIRTLYFTADAETIGDHFARAIDLLKELPDEGTRERAAVFMEGLAQMRHEWAGARRSRPGDARPPAGRKR